MASINNTPEWHTWGEELFLHSHTREGWQPNTLDAQAMSSTLSGHFVYLLSQDEGVHSGCSLLTWVLCLNQRRDCFPPLPSCLSSTKHCVCWTAKWKSWGVCECVWVNSIMVWKTCSITPWWPLASYFFLPLCFHVTVFSLGLFSP